MWIGISPTEWQSRRMEAVKMKVSFSRHCPLQNYGPQITGYMSSNYIFLLRTSNLLLIITSAPYFPRPRDLYLFCQTPKSEGIC